MAKSKWENDNVLKRSKNGYTSRIKRKNRKNDDRY